MLNLEVDREKEAAEISGLLYSCNGDVISWERPYKLKYIY